MTPEGPTEVAFKYAANLERMKKLSTEIFKTNSTENLFDPTKVKPAKNKKTFHKVKGAKPKSRNFYSTSITTAVGPTQSQLERISLQRMLDEEKLSLSEKKYFSEKIQRKIKEFKSKAAGISSRIQKKLDRKGVFSPEVNHLRSSSMQTVIMRNIMIKRMPDYIKNIKSEIKDLRNGQSIKVITALDKAAMEEAEKEQRRDLLVRLKKAVTNQIGEVTSGKVAHEETEVNLANKLSQIISEKLPIRRVKPLDMKLQVR